MPLDPRLPLCAALHLDPSPGCHHHGGIATARAALEADLDALGSGWDAVILENDNDKPHTLTIDPAQVAFLTSLATRARALVGVRLGVNVQRIDWLATLAIAAAAELDFIRLDVYVDRVRMLDQEVVVEPEAVLAERARLRIEHVELWVDVHVKHADMLDSDTLEESARRAVAAGADVVLVSGDRTGEPPSLEDLDAAGGAGGPARGYNGSGRAPQNAATLAPRVGGALVGTALKSGDRIDGARARQMVEAWRACRQDSATTSTPVTT